MKKEPSDFHLSADRAQIVPRDLNLEKIAGQYEFLSDGKWKRRGGGDDAMRSRTLWYSPALILPLSLSPLSLLGIQKTRLLSSRSFPSCSLFAEKFDFYPTQGIVD